MMDILSSLSRHMPHTSWINGTSLAQQAASSLFLLGTLASQVVLGRFSGDLPTRGSQAILRRSVDSFVARERPIALARLICNIGPSGCAATGASPGVVVASPDRASPDYFYTWTRDSALVFKGVLESFSHEYSPSIQTEITNYIAAQARAQGVTNPSGSLNDGSGLGEPKFHVDLTAFSDSWGRPQRDGPALRASTLLAYARWLDRNGYNSTATEIVWPIVRNDLSYVAQYWNQSGFDIWEEVRGSSFFTVAIQYRALVEGATFAKSLGVSCEAYVTVAPQILCFLQEFWSPSSHSVIANFAGNERTAKDANTLLGSIHIFDPDAGCDATTFQPCSDKSLANHKAVVDSFRFYPINQGVLRGVAIAVGRYSEDEYFGGNPWYINTLAAAELLYDAVQVWKRRGTITITPLSLEFFRDLVPHIDVGTYISSSSTFEMLCESVSTYADGFMHIVATYTPPDGSLSEQFDKADGRPLSAHHLTWSYAAFLTAASRRDGVTPESWGAFSDGKAVPSTCSHTSIVGTYSLATSTTFPTSQTPIAVPTTTSTGCDATAAVAVTFRELVTTEFGQTVKIVGDVDTLGNWNFENAVELGASGYSEEYPLWTATISLRPGQMIQYKYINVYKDGSVHWEADPNHTYTAPVCATTATRLDRWQH